MSSIRWCDQPASCHQAVSESITVLTSHVAAADCSFAGEIPFPAIEQAWSKLSSSFKTLQGLAQQGALLSLLRHRCKCSKGVSM